MGLIRVFAILFGLTLALAGGLFGQGEYRVARALAAPIGPATLSPAWQENKEAGILSVPAVIGNMDRCARAQMSLASRLFPTRDRQTLARKCLTAANLLLARNPTLSVAHFAKAVSLRRLGRELEAQMALATARNTAPNEGWLAHRRVQFAMDQIARLSPENHAGFAQDIALLLAAPPTAIKVAHQYVREVEHRNLIRQIVGQRPLADQQRFLAMVRREMMRPGSGS